LPVTLKDIAREAQISVTQVSRALGGYNDVNKDTREKVLTIAKKMGYHPNQLARQLQSQRTNVIGMVIPSDAVKFSDDYFQALILSIGHAISEYGFYMMFSTYSDEVSEMAAYRDFVGGKRVDGMILARTRINDQRIQYLKEQNHPFVVQGRLSANEIEDFSFVDLDNELGIQLLCKHLIELGHQNLAIILPPQGLAYTQYRLDGFFKAMQSASLHVNKNHIFQGNLTQQSGYEQTKNILEKLPKTTAIVACNDLMALGAMNAVQDRGLVVGHDIAVVGFDDVLASQIASPPLTTIHQPIDKTGDLLVEILVNLIKESPTTHSQILLEPELIVRRSSVPSI